MTPSFHRPPGILVQPVSAEPKAHAPRVLSIDPGTKLSAFLIFDGTKPLDFGKIPNAELLARIHAGQHKGCHLAIESMVSYGQMVGQEVFDTCVWIGRLIEAWATRYGEQSYTFLRRADIKSHICGSAKANDSGVREALIYRFGGAEKAVGGKKCPACKGKPKAKLLPCQTCRESPGYQTAPGPLTGITSDVWSALAIACTHWDQQAAAASWQAKFARDVERAAGATA